MLKTYSMLKEDLVKEGYKAPEMKIKRMTEKKEIIRLTGNLHETETDLPGYAAACDIITPSYLSFEFALSHYGLIPEAVFASTSATCGRRKRKIYQNDLGCFIYQDIPKEAFYREITFLEEEGRRFPIATAEKSVCDRIYTLKPPVRSKKEMIYMLFTDLRIDEDDFMELDFEVLKDLCPLYRSTTLNTFKKVIEDLEKDKS